MSKTHYRIADKSDYLGSADVEQMIEENTPRNFTIKNVKFERGILVNGRKGDFRIARFVENIKPMVLNATNAKKMASMAKSVFLEDWNNIPVELYVEQNVRNPEGGDPVTGLRIRKGKTTETKVKPDLTPTHAKWKGAVDSIASGSSSIEIVKGYFTLTKENEQRLLAEAEQLTQTGEIADA